MIWGSLIDNVAFTDLIENSGLNIIMEDTDLSGADLTGANLTRANLADANLQMVVAPNLIARNRTGLMTRSLGKRLMSRQTPLQQMPPRRSWVQPNRFWPKPIRTQQDQPSPHRPRLTISPPRLGLTKTPSLFYRPPKNTKQPKAATR